MLDVISIMIKIGVMTSEQAEKLALTIIALTAAIGSLEETIARVGNPPPSRPSSGKTKVGK